MGVGEVLVWLHLFAKGKQVEKQMSAHTFTDSLPRTVAWVLEVKFLL